MTARIRNSFVSNSSSSSFIIMGESISFKDAKNFDDAIWILEEWCEGNDVINLTPEVLEFLDQNPNVIENLESRSQKIFANRKTISFEGECGKESISKSDLHKEIYSFDKSHHSCEDDLEDIKRRYSSDDHDSY